MRQVIGYRNFPDFLKKVYSVAIRFTKDRCLDLPAKVFQRRVVRLDQHVSRLYRELERECVASLGLPGDQLELTEELARQVKIASPLVLSKLMKLSQITGGFLYEQGPDGERVATHQFASNPKLDDLEEFLEETGNAKTIVFCRFKREIEMVADLLRRKAIGFTVMDGSTSPEERGEAVRAFQEDVGIRGFIGQISTAGLGITLTSAHYVYYYSNTYSLEDRLQSEDRPHRKGLDHPVIYAYIVAETHDGKLTIDHEVLRVLKGKAAFAQEGSSALVARMRQPGDFDGPAERANPAYARKGGSKYSDPILENNDG